MAGIVLVILTRLESPLDCKEIQPVHSKGDQTWVFIGRTDVEAETLILWPPPAKIWLIGKDSDAGRDWGQEEKGTTEDEMAGWHHWLDGHEFEWALGVGDGQGGLCYAKSLQSCPTLCDPLDGSPPGSPVPGILQARTLEWVAISFSNAWKWKEKVKSLSHVRLFATPWTAAYQAPPSMGFSRQEYWSGMPLPSPTGRPGVLLFMGLQRVRHDWAAELNWTLEWCWLGKKGLDNPISVCWLSSTNPKLKHLT